MKKILVSFATLAVVSSSIMTTTAWVKNKQHIQTKDTDHQLGRDTDYSDLDFGNFQSVMHPFSFQKLDPTIADVNVNFSIGNPDGVYYHEIAVQLDQRLANYYSYFGISDTVLEDSILGDLVGTNYNIIDQNTGNAWVPPTDPKSRKYVKSGQYECYNLQLVNLLSHTSFTFSLNYCNFDLNKIIKPINATPDVDNQVYSISDASSNGGVSDFFPWNSSQPYTNFDLSSYLQNVNSNATWPNQAEDKYYNYLLKIDNYFLNPITWKWDSSLEIVDFYGTYYAPLLDNSDQGGYNSQINYQIDQNSTDHYGLVKPVSPPLKGGGAWPRKWQANTLSENNVHGGAASGDNGRLDEYGDSGWASTSEMYNVWNMNGDTEHDESSDWGQDAQDMIYVDQFWSGDGTNQINLAPYIAGFSNVSDWEGAIWYLDWTFNTTELDTSYKDVFSQASAYQVTGLEDYSTFMTYKDPNKILKNYSLADGIYGVNEIYDLYDSAQTVTFNSNYVTSATVDYQSIPLDTPYTINQGSHVIDVRLNDLQQATEYQGNYDSAGDIEFHMDVQTGYDFSEGVGATTLNKTKEVDNQGDTIYDVDVYMKGKSATQLSQNIKTSGEYNRFPVLKELSNIAVVDPPWQNILNSGENLIDGIVQYGNNISNEKQVQNTNLNNFLSGYNAISADQSVLGWGGEEESSSYRRGLTNRINAIDGSKLGQLQGIMFHFMVSWDGGAWHCQNFDKSGKTDPEYAYDTIVEPQLINPVKAITPSLAPITPSTPSEAQQIADDLKVIGIVLDPKYWVGKDIKNYKEQLDNVLVAQRGVSRDELQYVSWSDLTLQKGTTSYTLDFTVTKDGQTVIGNTHIEFNTKALFHWLNVGFEQGIMKEEGGEIQYIGAAPPYGSIDTSNPSVMQNLISSIWKDPAIVYGYYNSYFFKEYSRYISFDQTKVHNGGQIMMHIKVGNYTKDYKVRVWWRTAS